MEQFIREIEIKLLCCFLLFIPIMAVLLAADHLSETLLCHFPVSTDSSNHTFFFCCIFDSYTSGLVHVVNQKFFLYLFFQQPYMSLALQDQTVFFLASLFPAIAFDSYFIKHMMWLWTSSNHFANLFYGSQIIQHIISPQCLLLRGNILTNPSLPAACAVTPDEVTLLNHNPQSPSCLFILTYCSFNSQTQQYFELQPRSYLVFVEWRRIQAASKARRRICFQPHHSKGGKNGW